MNIQYILNRCIEKLNKVFLDEVNISDNVF